MKLRFSIGLALCVLMILGAPAAFAFQAPQPFSADFSTTSGNGNARMNGKFYFSLPKTRMDMADTGQQRQNAGPFGGKMTMIIDGTNKIAYMLMVDQQMYMEFPLDQNNPFVQRMPKFQTFAGDPCSVTEGATCKKLGTEAMNGRSCDKWEETLKNGQKETLWIDQKLHFPIKTVSDKGDISEFTNIKEGEQDAALFKVPSGYRKFDASAYGQRPH